MKTCERTIGEDIEARGQNQELLGVQDQVREVVDRAASSVLRGEACVARLTVFSEERDKQDHLTGPDSPRVLSWAHGIAVAGFARRVAPSNVHSIAPLFSLAAELIALLLQPACRLPPSSHARLPHTGGEVSTACL